MAVRIPKKLTMAELSDLRVSAHKLKNNALGLRYGQAFMSAYNDKYGSVEFQELFYETDYQKAEKLIVNNFLLFVG